MNTSTYLGCLAVVLCVVLQQQSASAVDIAPRKSFSDFSSFSEYKSYLNEVVPKEMAARQAEFEKNNPTTPKPKPTTEKPKPKTTKKVTTKKPTKKTKAPEKKKADDVFQACCQERSDIPEKCYKYCHYNQFTTKAGITRTYLDKKCPIEAMQPMFGCASQLQDNSKCCDRLKMKSKCKILCPAGVEDVTIGKDFFECLNDVGKYGTCFEAKVQERLDDGDEDQLGW